MLERETPEARASYLDDVCGRDPVIRRRVELLLEAHSDMGSFLEEPAWVPELSLSSHVAGPHALQARLAGQTIGPYELIEEVGEGGMGMVFLAEQKSPVRRQVAIKIIKPGMVNLQVTARFEAERQALALMDHPGIARLLDAGATDEVGPYFIMELVRGLSITDHCDQNQLTIRDRLDLFVSVCQAVQHFHQKGIVHRDLKPSHVLVGLYGSVPAPKIIDFGIAKATVAPPRTDKTVDTSYGQFIFIGTPLYMSPEQAGEDSGDVDARSDIYSLGVMLYELIVGLTPIDQERLRSAGYGEIRRMIREEDPPRPSARVQNLGTAGLAIAARRQTDLPRLNRMLRHDLDWIMMKALSKDRSGRYQTAGGLAGDIQRYLNDEPIEAHAALLVDRTDRWARRQQAGVCQTVGSSPCCAL